MEEQLQNILSVLSKKRVETFEIVGKVDSGGYLKVTLPNKFEFDEDKTYFVSLVSFESDSNFINIDSKNNILYYSEPNSGIIKSVTFPNGSYELSDLTNYLVTAIGKAISPIHFSVHEPTGRSRVTLETGYKIYFKDKANTFKDIIGFDNVDITESCFSPRIINVLRFRKIYISCDIAKGAVFNDKYTTIIYSFGNNLRFGSILSKHPKTLIPFLLSRKTFNDITFRFFSENNDAIDFMGSDVAITLLISQS